MVVSHSNSTSNHNIIGVAAVRPKVVSHSNSTSNHNISLEEARLELLFLIPILHQTTTYERSGKRCALLFLIPILHQTTTAMQTSTSSRCCFSFQFYIKPQHFFAWPRCGDGCFSFQFYIKPQPTAKNKDEIPVVSHSNSTSNHNRFSQPLPASEVVSHSNSTSNHNVFCISRMSIRLFLIPILHQTTTSRMAVIHILHVTHMTPMHKTSCRTPGKLVGCNFVFQRAIYQKNSSC